MKRAIVLSGGGAKGAYEIGVWKALRKLKIDYQVVTGTSVGALNGILMVQNDYKKAIKLWKNMNFNIVFDEETLKNFNNVKTSKDMINMFSTNFIQNGGMNISNLENLVKNLFNKEKFYNSNIDYSFSTYNISDLKECKFKKSDFNDEKIIDYIIASSSCYPAFKMKKIEKKNYIDGGCFDNLPINSAIDMNCDEIIAIDLHAPGIKEKVKKNNIPITIIEPNNDIGNFLNFNKENSLNAIRLGYLDTLKKFNKLDGKKYTFKKNTLTKCHDRYNEEIVLKLNKVFDFKENKTTLEELLTLTTYKRLISLKKHNSQNIINDIIEYTMSTFDLDNKKIYNKLTMHYHIFNELYKCNNINKNNIKDLTKREKLLTITNRRSIIKYFYLELFRTRNNPKLKKDLCKLALIYPKEFLSSLYLYSVRKKSII